MTTRAELIAELGLKPEPEPCAPGERYAASDAELARWAEQRRATRALLASAAGALAELPPEVSLRVERRRTLGTTSIELALHLHYGPAHARRHAQVRRLVTTDELAHRYAPIDGRRLVLRLYEALAGEVERAAG